MRLDGGITPTGTQDADFYLPRFFVRDYPELVQFLDLYFDSLYEIDLNVDQFQYFMDNESWWADRDRTFESADERNLQKVVALDKYRRNNFGILGKTARLIENKTLERSRSLLEAIDGFVVADSASVSVTAERDEVLPLRQWLESKGFNELAESPEDDINFDVINFIKIARHLFKIRGSLHCAKVLLEAMYSARVEIELPRRKIARIDDNFAPDTDIRTRDDDLYDEFTYVINLIGGNTQSIGLKYFNMYKRLFHPSGFNVVLRIYTDDEWLIVSGDYLDLPEGIRVWSRFVENEFLPTMLGIEKWLA